jgi:hypothetical protein
MAGNLLPQKFYKNDPLLPRRKGDYLDYNGCVPNIGGTQAGSGLSYCSYYMGYDLNNPDPEYELSLSDNPCSMCSFWYGCGNNNNPAVASQSCGSCSLGLSGRKCRITRTGYGGDPSSCCLVAASATNANPAITTNAPVREPTLFNWNDVQGTNFTCNPNLLENCGTSYSSIIAGYCSTLSKYGTQKAWQPGTPNNDYVGYCNNFVKSMNQTNKATAQTVLGAAVNTMSTDPNFSDFGKSDPAKAGVISNLLQFCDTMGTCDAQLKQMCKAYTREEIFDAYKKYLELVAINPDDQNAVAYKNIYQACGCHLSPSQYTEWSNLGVDETNVSCDPLCVLPNVVPQFSGGAKATCNQSLCILDNITVDIINSQTGDINFNTLCGNCKGGQCRCVFSNVNIFQSGSSVGNINFEQNCGTCSTPDPNNPGNFINIDCKSGMPSGPPVEKTWWDKTKAWISENKGLTFIIAIIILIVIGWVVWLMFGPSTDEIKSPADEITLSDLLGNYGYEL